MMSEFLLNMQIRLYELVEIEDKLLNIIKISNSKYKDILYESKKLLRKVQKNISYELKILNNVVHSRSCLDKIFESHNSKYKVYNTSL